MSDKRLELEKAATNTVQQVGLSNLSFRTLADEVGIKSSSVHYYFPEKSHLANAIIDSYTDQFRQKLDKIDSLKSHPSKKLMAFTKIFEDVAKANKFCLCGMMAAEVSSLQEETRELLNGYFQQAEDWLNQIFVENKDNLSVDIKPRQLAKIVMSGLEGAILIDRVDGKFDRLRAQRELILQLIK